MSSINPVLGFALVSVIGVVAFWVVPIVLVYYNQPDARSQYKTKAERQDARDRAERLLADVLTDDEHIQLRRKGYLAITRNQKTGRVYRISNGYGK